MAPPCCVQLTTWITVILVKLKILAGEYICMLVIGLVFQQIEWVFGQSFERWRHPQYIPTARIDGTLRALIESFLSRMLLISNSTFAISISYELLICHRSFILKADTGAWLHGQ